jgi:pimeloyl-ACP methyl ester carboxylesterase
LAVAALAAASGLVPPDQVEGFTRVVRTFLEASLDDSVEQREAARLLALAQTTAATLPDPARHIVTAVINRNVEEVGRLVEPLVAGLAADPSLSPELSPPPTAPVYLVHGDADNVIPSTETPLLALYLNQHGHDRVRWLLTPILSHADVNERPSLLDVWRLIRFWTVLRSALNA